MSFKQVETKTEGLRPLNIVVPADQRQYPLWYQSIPHFKTENYTPRSERHKVFSPFPDDIAECDKILYQSAQDYILISNA